MAGIRTALWGLVRCAVLFILTLLLCAGAAQAAGETRVLDEINLARTRPQAYAEIVAARMSRIPDADPRCVAEAIAFLNRQRPLEALQTASGLEKSAQDHVSEQAAAGLIGHRSPDGGSPWKRMSRWGQWAGRTGENISYGYSDARSIVVTLIVDQGVPDRGHRKNIFCEKFKRAGAARGPHARYGAMCVIDFAEVFAEKGEALAMTEPWRGADGL